MPLRADRVKLLQQQMGYSNRHIATLIGINENTVSRWVSGRQQPNSLRLNQLAAVLEVSEGYLLGNTDDKTPPPPDTGELSGDERRLILAIRDGDESEVNEIMRLLFGRDG